MTINPVLSEKQKKYPWWPTRVTKGKKIMDPRDWKENPRKYALDMYEEGLVSADTLLIACLKFMSHDAVRELLDINGLSPRFLEQELG